MRRGLAGLLFFIAAICLALAAGGWWLQRVAFDTDTSRSVAAAVLDDDAIRAQVATVVADAAAPAVGVPAAELRTFVDQLAQSTAGAELMDQIVADAHARLTGQRSEPVQITGDQLVQIVRDERAAAVPPITLPVQEVAVLSTIRTGLDWFVPGMAIAGGAALLLGLLAHPRKSDAVFGIGMLCVFAAVAAVLLGYVVPAHLFPTFSDNTWTSVIPAVARDSLPIVVTAAVVLLAGGLALIMGSAAARRRRAWSAPVGVGRYADHRRWS